MIAAGWADHLVVANHGDQAVEVPAEGVDLLTGQSTGSSVKVAAGGVAVVRVAPTG